MIDQVIRYLKHRGVPFRVVSYPAPERLPHVGFPRPPESEVVSTHVILAGGSPALVCAPPGELIDVSGLGQRINSVVVGAEPSDLPAPFNTARHIPPLGGLVGVPLFVDERVVSQILIFRAFDEEDYVELSIDDFLRMEQPRVVAFAVGGWLPAHTEASAADAPVVPRADAPVLPAADAMLDAPGAPAAEPAVDRAGELPIPIDAEHARRPMEPASSTLEGRDSDPVRADAGARSSPRKTTREGRDSDPVRADAGARSSPRKTTREGRDSDPVRADAGAKGSPRKTTSSKAPQERPLTPERGHQTRQKNARSTG